MSNKPVLMNRGIKLLSMCRPSCIFTSNWFIRLNLLLLLLCPVNYQYNNETFVTKKREDNMTLQCELKASEISNIHLTFQGDHILQCDNKKCNNSENNRVFKEGSCDVIIKDLIFSDAGTYILRVYYDNDQREVEAQIRTYRLYIHDEISVNKGEPLKLDVLVSNADKVEHQNITSKEWTEVWTRGHGVSSDRLTDRDGNLTINNLTVTDAGRYKVLDSEGEIWITVSVTVTEFGLTEQRNNSKQNTAEYWILRVVLPVVFGFVVIAVLIYCWKQGCLQRWIQRYRAVSQ